MKHLKKSLLLIMLLTVIIGSRTFAQSGSAPDLFKDRIGPNLLLSVMGNSARAREVMQDNEYTTTGNEQGNFYVNPLMLDGKLLDYGVFSVRSSGELTVIKGAPATAKTTEVQFYVYLRRDGKKVRLTGNEASDVGHTKIEIKNILQFAKPGDQLVIEAVNKEDGPVKRILMLLEGGGC